MMKKLFSMLALVWLLVGIAQAQTADEIVTKMIQARGGADNLNKLNSVLMEGTMSVMGMDIPMKMIIANKRGMRTEMEIMGQSIVIAMNGSKGWMINPMSGTDPVDLPEDQLKAAAPQMDLAGLANFKTNGTTVELLGQEKIDGNDAYKLKMVTAGGTEVINFVDANTYNIVKTVAKSVVNGQTVEAETKLSNYKVFEGVSFPCTTETNNPQAGTMIANFAKITVNAPVDEKIFEKPNK